MKFTYISFVFALVTSLQPTFGAETNAPPSALEEKFREIDLKLMAEQYEDIKRQVMKMELEMRLLQAEGTDNTQKEPTIKRWQRRQIVLREQLDELAVEARRIRKAVPVARK